MDTLRVGPLREGDRLALCRMLEGSADFPQSLLYLYRRRASRQTTFVAWRGENIDGMLTGAFDSDLGESGAFDPFELPPPPHAFLERIHVRPAARSESVGPALIEAYANEASARGCTFIGGSIDLSSEPTRRRAFFKRQGFNISESDYFGAYPSDLIGA